jgi:tetratricopeptide (TPR) repeat protein
MFLGSDDKLVINIFPSNAKNHLFRRQIPVSKLSKPFSSTSTADKQIVEDILQAIDSGNIQAGLDLIDSAPAWIQKKPEFMMMRAAFLAEMDETLEALWIFREVTQKYPHIHAAKLELVNCYVDQEWNAHALDVIEQLKNTYKYNEEGLESIKEVETIIRNIIQTEADKHQLPLDKFRKACYQNEEALMAMNRKNLSGVDHFAREAIKLAPTWCPPYTNHAEALFYTGKISEAISTLEKALVLDPDNVVALSSIITYHVGINQVEQAQQYAQQLANLLPTYSMNGNEIDFIITAFALLEDTARLSSLAEKYTKQPAEDLLNRSWICLAVAAVRSENWKAARLIHKKIYADGLAEGAKLLYSHIQELLIDPSDPNVWRPLSYPGTDLFFYPTIMSEWYSLDEKIPELSLEKARRKLDDFFLQYPFMHTALRKLLWDQEGHVLAIQNLLLTARPDAVDDILRFGLSQTGDQKTRMVALIKLAQKGLYSGPKTVKVWDEKRLKWRDVEVVTQCIGEVVVNARPDTMNLIRQSQATQNQQEALNLLQKAVDGEPTSPMAAFNLGVILSESGEVEEGEALMRRSIEIDPDYHYGHASMALSAATHKDELTANEHLQIVKDADVISPETAAIYNLAMLVLALNKYDFDTAFSYLQIATELNPNHKLLPHFRELIAQSESMVGAMKSLLKYQEKSLQRAQKKMLGHPLSAEMGLRACLNLNTKDMLVGIARFLRTTSSGKKDELADWLADSLLDPEFMQETLDDDLSTHDREALGWLLATDETVTWQELVTKFGSDENESVYWSRHQPESVPGRLRAAGLLYSGVMDGQVVAFIPVDVRLLLKECLAKSKPSPIN